MDLDFEKYIVELESVLMHERNAHRERYGVDIDSTNLKELKSRGFVIHPLKVQHRYYFSDETPVVDFELMIGGVSQLFKLGTPVKCFQEKNSVEGQVVSFQGEKISVALNSDTFPDWIEERGVGLALIPDEHTFEKMQQAIDFIKFPKNSVIKSHVLNLGRGFETQGFVDKRQFYENEKLNDSQNKAILAILQNEGIQIVHGPPGTGKTTVLSCAIQALVKAGKRVLVAAPSNTAVDHFAKVLIRGGVKVLRVGNNIKIDDEILDYTIEGYLSRSAEIKQIKMYQKSILELRKKAGQFKRVFDKASREERNAYYQEIKALRREIKSLRVFSIDKTMQQCQVILGTPVGLSDELGSNYQTDYLFIDEAGQCHDALAWLLFGYALNVVLSGDIHQLPPTYLSSKNLHNPMASSILHNLQQSTHSVYFLDTQYRMEPRIASFSNRRFYDNRLKHSKPESAEQSVLFFDTAGMGFEEQQHAESGSRFNEGEIELIQNFIELNKHESISWVVISPYQAHVEMLKNRLGLDVRISTIDSFQGQESPGVILSLVRCNDNQEIGFLKDYRRMNVALTRAQNRLVVFGDSSTIGLDSFYAEFLDYCEAIGSYHSGFELVY